MTPGQKAYEKYRDLMDSEGNSYVSGWTDLLPWYRKVWEGLAAEAVAEEREACAKIADAKSPIPFSEAGEIAAAIRARSNP